MSTSPNPDDRRSTRLRPFWPQERCLFVPLLGPERRALGVYNVYNVGKAGKVGKVGKVVSKEPADSSGPEYRIETRAILAGRSA
ncbi:MAG: hypothetical protein M3471_04300, partial [Actinomycetota bacterium]|nr:hypothetical protein [Actinomycetota bacterium]